ncbi:MAG: bifunctional demethylmenaquinone methyltransferase/2-methoxy-6-polyprenyl-1,4-benzoquinol methylase UbiE [Chloroflexota bacterium]
MGVPPQGLRSQYVSAMFGAIADRYDLMNRLMTFGQDLRWRRQAADVAAVGPGDTVLDVATGTGDLAFAVAECVQPNGKVTGVDFSEPMLRNARRKATERKLPVVLQFGDALNLPFDANTFDAATCGFGLRNVDDRDAALREMVRVVRPGKRVVILELTPPANLLARQYMDEVIPRLGQMIARARDAYTYLPESVVEFPDAGTLGGMMQSAGLKGVTYRLLNFGTVALHWGTKPAAANRI